MEIERTRLALVKMYNAAIRRKEKMNREVERRKKANERAARQRLEKDEQEAKRRQRHEKALQPNPEWSSDWAERQIQSGDEKTKQERPTPTSNMSHQLRPTSSFSTSEMLLEEEGHRPISTPISNLSHHLRTGFEFTATEEGQGRTYQLQVFVYPMGLDFEDSLGTYGDVRSLLLPSVSVVFTEVLHEEEQEIPTPTSNLGPTTTCSTSDPYEEERQRPGTNETLKNADSPRSSTALQHDAAAADPDQCSICYDRKKDSFCAPCGHQLCRVCLYSLEQCVCPFCRAEIESTGRIQAPNKSKYY